MNTNSLIGLDTAEFRLLSEKFELMTEDDQKEIPKYVIFSRTDKIKRLVHLAIENELDENSQKIVRERYFDNMKITDIAIKHGVSRQTVHRTLKKSENKLFSVLKYAYYCGFSLISAPENFEELFQINEEKIYEQYNNRTN